MNNTLDLNKIFEEMLLINKNINSIKELYDNISKIETTQDISNIEEYINLQIIFKQKMVEVENFINRSNYFYSTIDMHKNLFETLKNLYVSTIKEIRPEEFEDEDSHQEDEDIDIDNLDLFKESDISNDEYNKLFNELLSTESNEYDLNTIDNSILQDYINLQNLTDNNDEVLFVNDSELDNSNIKD